MNTENENEAVNEATEQSTAQAAPAQEAQKNVLLGTITYTNDDDYENFLSNLDVNQAMFVLMASANYTQAKGVYNLDESELVARAIKTIKKNSAPATPAATEPVASEESNS